MSDNAAAVPNSVNYGGTSDSSTVGNMEEGRGVRQSKAIPASNAEKALRSHTLSTMALCTSVLSMFYLLMSAFPYSGFMAMQLMPSLTPQSAGTYAGILSGSVMMGRMLSAWPLGVVCDRYGRKFVLLFSTATNAVLMLAFGLSPTYGWAVSVRFLTGMCNGTMVAARVSVSELAKGNRELEARGMGMVMSMIGFGMLLGPALGGVLSEPVTQYPNIDFGPFESLLLHYPFVLPNVVGAVIATASVILIALTVDETLPDDKLRSPKHIPEDIAKSIANIFRRCKKDEYEEISTSVDDEEEEDSIADDLKIIGMHFGEAGDAAAMSSKSSRASFTTALHRPSSIRRLSISTKAPHAVRRKSTNISLISHNITSLMRDKHVRECLNCYWMTSIASTMAGEAFPLFAMATVGGLGIEEKAIGLIGAGSGLLFVISQYFIFSVSMKHLGLHRTMVSSCLLAVPPVVFIPLSLLFKQSKSTMMAYLSLLNGVMNMAFSSWNAALTITQNRAVDPGSRAKLNALAAIGASLARGGGPMLAGALVAFSYTGSLVPPMFGSLVTYSVIAFMGAVAFVMCSRLEDEDEAEKGVR